MAKYIVYLEPAEEGGYIAYCPDFPGCATQGETVEDALTMVQDAIGGYIESLKKHGEHIPQGLGDQVERIEVIQVVQV